MNVRRSIAAFLVSGAMITGATIAGHLGGTAASAAPTTPAQQLHQLEKACTRGATFTLGIGSGTARDPYRDVTFICAEQQPASQCREASLNPTCFAYYSPYRTGGEALLDLFGQTTTVGGSDQ
jgi:hypothetical protein